MPCTQVKLLLLGLVFMCFHLETSLLGNPKQLEEFPLARRVADKNAKTLFSVVSESESGVRFVLEKQDGSKDPLKKNPFFVTRRHARGVCAGDFDGDGWDDLFFAHPYGGHRLFRNLGGFKFEDVTLKAGLEELFADHWAVGCSFADVDGDGNLDLFVAGTGDRNLLLRNLGNGKFKDMAKELHLERTGASVQMTFADYDRDGDLDAFLVTNRLSDKPAPSEGTEVKGKIVGGRLEVEEKYREIFNLVRHPTERVRVVKAGEYDLLYRNDGDRFREIGRELGIEGADEGLAAVWFDYDRDGWIDLYVANDFYGPDRLYRNEQGKGFRDMTKEVLPHVPWFSMGIDQGDVNNDGWFDIMTTDMAGSNHYKSKIGMGDMDKDGWFLRTAYPRQYMRNCLFLNTGGKAFLEVGQMAGLAGTDWTWSVKFGDFDNDGWIDLLGTNGMTQDRTNSDLLNQANALKTDQQKSEFWKKVPPKKDENFVFKNLGGLAFEKVSQKWGFADFGVSFGVALADFDRDGDLDAAVASMDTPYRLYRNNSSTGSSVSVRLEGTDRNRWGIGATVQVVTELGSYWRTLASSQGYASANSPVLHFGLGKARKIERLKVSWPRGEVQEFENLALNKRFVIRQPGKGAFLKEELARSPVFGPVEEVFADTPSHKENVLDDYAIQPLLPYRPSQLGPGMAAGDVDGDGEIDLFHGQGGGTGSRLLKGEVGPRFLSLPQRYFSAKDLLPFEDMGSVLFDADSDRDLDLYVVSGGYDPGVSGLYLRDRLFLNDGKGMFSLGLPNTPNLRDSGGTVSACDFDRDGDLDLFVGGRVARGEYPEIPSSSLLLNQGGKFTDVTDALAPGLRNTGMVTSSLWSDFDGDGWSDLVLTTEWGPVEFWKNEKGKLVDRTQEAGTANRLGWWTSVAHADFDNDGDLDYAVGNMSLNTKYHASPENPYFAYWGDIDGSGKLRFVEACKENGRVYPVRGKSCSTRAIPSLAKKFQTFHAFAQAGLSEIYQPEILRRSRKLEINELASGLLINSGNGKFVFKELPLLAQTSPILGMAIADFDGDGWDDLAANQNFFPMQPETGRLNGGTGLLLQGDGNGDFRPFMEHESGILFQGDGRALLAQDLNGDFRPDLIASFNSGKPKALINQSRAGRPFCLKISGDPGNLRGTGSRIMIHYRDGRKKACQLTLGSSYLSAPEPQLFLSQTEGNPIESVTIHSPLGVKSTHSLKGSSGIVKIRVLTR
jgi:enediyne biosynthesis protein E4